MCRTVDLRERQRLQRMLVSRHFQSVCPACTSQTPKLVGGFGVKKLSMSLIFLTMAWILGARRLIELPST